MVHVLNMKGDYAIVTELDILNAANAKRQQYI